VIQPGRILPLVLLAAGVALLVAAGVCYQVTGGGALCHWALGVATACCIGAFALAWQR
jgi:hypothetical protein